MSDELALAGMNEKRRAFVREYLVDFSPGQAAIRAGYVPENASVVGASLMKIPAVRDAIARSVAARSKRVGLNADRVLEHLGKLLLGDPRSVLHEDGTLKTPHEMNDDDAMMIAGVKTRRIVELGEDGKIHNAEVQEVRLVDKVQVMALAMRHLGMLNDKLVLEVGGTLAEQLAAAQARIGNGQGAVIEGTAGLARDELEQVVRAESGVQDAEWTEVAEQAPNEWEHLI